MGREKPGNNKPDYTVVEELPQVQSLLIGRIKTNKPTVFRSDQPNSQ
jgi:hypothetical protein